MAFSNSDGRLYTDKTPFYDGGGAQTQTDVQELLAHVDIVQVISQVVELRPQGGGEQLVGLCPFHNDTNPSLSVNPSKGVYRCWVCTAGMGDSSGGNAITFVRRYYNLPMHGAVNYLMENFAGVRHSWHKRDQKKSFHPKDKSQATLEVKRKEAARPFSFTAHLNQRLKDSFVAAKKAISSQEICLALRDAQHYYEECLYNSTDGKGALHYLFEERGVAPDVAKRYCLGFAPDEFDGLVSTLGNHHKQLALIAAGLARRGDQGRTYDFFRNRLLFGIRDDRGQVVAFGGRNLGEDTFIDRNDNVARVPKYINSPDTRVFSKSKELFGWYEHKERIEHDGLALVVEGYMDVLALANHGLALGVSCMGTEVTHEHLVRLCDSAQRVVFCFDADRAGQDAAWRVVMRAMSLSFSQSSRLHFIQLPSGLDPDEYIVANGVDAFNTLVAQASDLRTFWQDNIKRFASDANGQMQVRSFWQRFESGTKQITNTLLAAQLALSATKVLGAPTQPYVKKGIDALLDYGYIFTAGKTTPMSRLQDALSRPNDESYQTKQRLTQWLDSLPPERVNVAHSLVEGLLQAPATNTQRTDDANHTMVLMAACEIVEVELVNLEQEMLAKALRDGSMSELDYLKAIEHRRHFCPS